MNEEIQEKVSFRISSVSSKVEPEPDLHTGSSSSQNVRVRNTGSNID